MATLLFAWELGSGLGHVAAIRPLAERLQGLGHHVIVAARDLDSAERMLGQLRIPLLQAPIQSTAPQNPIVPPSTIPDVLHNAGLGSFDSARGVISGWRSLFDLIVPDAVLFDHAPLALLASSDHSFRKVLIGTGLTCPPAVDRFPDWRAHDRPRPDSDVYSTEHSVFEVVNQYRAQMNCSPFRRLSDLFTDTDLTLLSTVKELDHFPDRSAGHYLGNWVSGSHGIKPKWPKGKGKRLFAYLKPYKELPYLLNLLAASACPTVAYIANCPAPLLKVACSTIEIQTTPVAIDHAIKHCDAAILHAGHGTTLQFLLGGKPLFLIPLVLEQRLTANRVMSLGAGVCVNPHDKHSLKNHLGAFLHNSTHGEAAQEFAQPYREMSAQLLKTALQSHTGEDSDRSEVAGQHFEHTDNSAVFGSGFWWV